MKKTSCLLLFIAIAMIMTACAPATTIPLYEDTPASTIQTAITPTPPMETPSQAPLVATEAATAAPTQTGPATCSLYNPLPPVDPTLQASIANMPPASADDWSRGNPDAKIVFIEYADYQCPYCAQLNPIVLKILQQHPNDVRFVFRIFPLPSHPFALITAQAAEAAGLQKKFFEYSDALFTNQGTWSVLEEPAVKDYLVKQAVDLGLNKEQFVKDMNSDAMVAKAKAAQNQAQQDGVTYTPFVVMNGQVWQETDEASMNIVISLLMHQSENYTECPPTVIDPEKTYTATIQTEEGDIVIKLYADKAPLSVNSLVFLSQQNWYKDQNIFAIYNDAAADGTHLALAGDHSGTAYGSAGYTIGLENSSATLEREGMVGLLNGSTLFITTAPQIQMNGKLTIIGEVTQGLDLVKQQTAPGLKITNITISEQ
jgi:protein-disulfide isomerase/cyclophilin family peptidyl-prolyl cis-trans isomerase